MPPSRWRLAKPRPSPGLGQRQSSLLYILSALEPPTSGAVGLEGQDPFALAPAALAEFRNARVGFVFQDHCLLPQCSVLENVLVPTLVAPRDRPAARRTTTWPTPPACCVSGTVGPAGPSAGCAVGR